VCVFSRPVLVSASLDRCHDLSLAGFTNATLFVIPHPWHLALIGLTGNSGLASAHAEMGGREGRSDKSKGTQNGGGGKDIERSAGTRQGQADRHRGQDYPLNGEDGAGRAGGIGKA
jgi:hypothetical protein